MSCKTDVPCAVVVGAGSAGLGVSSCSDTARTASSCVKRFQFPSSYTPPFLPSSAPRGGSPIFSKNPGASVDRQHLGCRLAAPIEQIDARTRGDGSLATALVFLFAFVRSW